MNAADPAWLATLAALTKIPAAPRKVTGSDNWYNGVQLFVDYLATVPPRMQRLTAPLRRYPREFRRVSITTRDDVRLDAWLGLAPAARGGRDDRGEPRDGIILVPGLYTSKDNPRIRERAARILREWGFHVLCVDLRGVGGSDRTFSTPGWKEAEDLLDTAAEFRRLANVRRVHLYGESLAASAVVIAAGLDGRSRDPVLDGRAIAMGAYADARRIVELYAHPRPEETALGRDFVTVQKFFNGLLRLQGYKGGRFDSYSRDGAAHYGTDEAEFLRRSSPQEFVSDAKIPLLIVHSDDDGLVPVSEAHALAKRARANANVHLWTLPWGYHCLYEMADPKWYWSVLEHVFEANGRRNIVTPESTF